MHYVRRFAVFVPVALALACPASDAGEPDGSSTSTVVDDDDGATSSSTGAATTTESSESSSSGGEVPIDVDLGGNAFPCIDIATQSLADFIPPDASVACVVPAGDGDGVVPNGVTVGSDCVVSGAIEEDRGGVWVWIVEVTAAGESHLVPFCGSAAVPPEMYGVTVDAGDGSDAALDPIVVEFAPGQPLAVGGEFPRYTVVEPSACGDRNCFYGYAFRIGASPFDGNIPTFAPSGIVHDDVSGVPIGFFHSLSIAGDPVGPGFEARPWVLALALDYCISADPDGCTGRDIEANGNGGVQVSVVMVPPGFW